MENNSTYPEYSALTAYALLDDLTGLKLKEEQFLEYANLAIEKIGHNVSVCKLIVNVEEEGTSFLPCDAASIIAVTDDDKTFGAWPVAEYQDGRVTYNRMGDSRKDFSPSNMLGRDTYLNYKFYAPNKLDVSNELEEETIFVLANVKMVDKEGNHLLFLKQAEALVWYAAYLYTQRNAFLGVPGIDLGYIRGKAMNAIADARVPDYVSDNSWDKILNAKASFGRKGYNKDFMFD